MHYFIVKFFIVCSNGQYHFIILYINILNVDSLS